MDWFKRSAMVAAATVGSPPAFLVACVLVVVWAASGFFLGFSDTWQLVINTTTSIVTFLVVFLIQYAQNRDTRAIRLKLDELLRTTQGARSSMVDLDRLSDGDIARLEEDFRRWRARGAAGTAEAGTPDQ